MPVTCTNTDKIISPYRQKEKGATDDSDRARELRESTDQVKPSKEG